MFLSSCFKIREADISRLSFAVELAEEFYGRFVCVRLCIIFNIAW